MNKFFICLIILFFSKVAYAYIDPGIGSLIIQSTVAGLAMSIRIISIYWNKSKNFIKKIYKYLFEKNQKK